MSGASLLLSYWGFGRGSFSFFQLFFTHIFSRNVWFWWKLQNIELYFKTYEFPMSQYFVWRREIFLSHSVSLNEYKFLDFGVKIVLFMKMIQSKIHFFALERIFYPSRWQKEKENRAHNYGIHFNILSCTWNGLSLVSLFIIVLTTLCNFFSIRSSSPRKNRGRSSHTENRQHRRVSTTRWKGGRIFLRFRCQCCHRTYRSRHFPRGISIYLNFSSIVWKNIFFA